MTSPLRGSVLFFVMIVAVSAVFSAIDTFPHHPPSMADLESLNVHGGEACSPCHAAAGFKHGRDSGAGDSPVVAGQWSASITAYGSDDPFWQAMVRSEVLRAPEDQEFIEAKCAACHGSKIRLLDARSRIVGTDFPGQMPFSEWRSSDLANLDEPVGCRQCHMSVEDRGRIENQPPRLDDRSRASHAFVSANTEILRLLAMEAALQGGDPAPLIASIDAGRELLTRAGDLELLDSALHDGALEFALRVDNLSGHKLPTAFPSRRVYLHAVVRNVADEIVFESGAMMNDGRIIGVDSDEDPTSYEPHHQTITSPEQVQVYEAVLGTTDNDVTTTLLRAAHYPKDNRVVPVGFDPATVPDDVRPTGGCTNDPDFGFGHDEITYRIDGLIESRYLVTVELRHQALGYPYVHELGKYPEDPTIARFLDLYDAVRPGSELIAEVVFSVGG